MGLTLGVQNTAIFQVAALAQVEFFRTPRAWKAIVVTALSQVFRGSSGFRPFSAKRTMPHCDFRLSPWVILSNPPCA
jgi:hypothetical protein